MSKYQPKTRFWAKFGPKWAHFGPGHFFECNNRQNLLDINAVYHNMQNQRNLMIQTRENGRKPQIWANLGPFCPNLGQINFFSKIGLRNFFKLIIGQFDAKNQENPMIGFREKLRTHGQTHGQGSIYRTNLRSRWVQKGEQFKQSIKSVAEI